MNWFIYYFLDSDDSSFIVKNGDTYTAYTKSISKTFSKSDIDGPRAFQEVSDNIYREVVDLSSATLADKTTLHLFNCKNGDCILTGGYLVIGGKSIAKCDTSDCNQSVSSDITASCVANDVGKVQIKSEGTTIQLCMANLGATTTYTSDDLDSSKVYFVGKAPATAVAQYIGNEDNTIIAMPTPGNNTF